VAVNKTEVSPLVLEMRDYVEGRRPFPTTTARRHHFVPAFALAQFARPTGDRKGWLFQLDLESGQSVRTRPHDAAFEIEMYTYEDSSGGSSNSIEVFFSRVEGHASEALARLRESPERLTPADRQTIAYYLVVQESRTPAGLGRRERLRQAEFEVSSALDLSTVAGFRQRFGADLGTVVSSGDDEALRQRMLQHLLDGRVTFEQPRAGAIGQLVEHVHDMAATVYALDWTVVIADGAGFITSDHPVSMVDLTPQDSWSGNAWVSSPGALSFHPLSPALGLLMRPGNCGLAIGPASEDRLAALNLMTYGWAQRRIFGATDEVVRSIREQAEAHPDAVPVPRAPKQVFLTPIELVTDSVRARYADLGWPAEIVVEGKDGPRRMGYVVVDLDDPPGTAAAAITDLIAGFPKKAPQERAAQARHRRPRPRIASDKL
jgi:hypothetical protein